MDLKQAAVRAKARKFATMVKQSNMAHKIPDDIIDSLTDDEVRYFMECLTQFRLVKRKDYLWEEDR